MENSVKDRLKEFIAYKKMSVRSFENSVKLSYGYVNNMRVSMQPDKVANIAHCYPELNTGWLMTGEGDMLKTIHAEPNTNYENLNHEPEKEMSAAISDKLINTIEQQNELLKRQQEDYNHQVQLLTQALERRDNMAMNAQEIHKEQVDRLISLLEKTVMGSEDNSDIVGTPKKRNTGLENRP